MKKKRCGVRAQKNVHVNIGWVNVYYVLRSGMVN